MKIIGLVAGASLALAAWAQYPQQQYPPQQYPPQQNPPQQYPPQQYPPQQQQYPAQQGYPQQYPAQTTPPGPPQAYPGQGPVMAPEQLDQVVQRVALYPDPLLAQVLTASTFYDQIPDASAWANEHNYLQGPELAQAMSADRLPFDPSVLALVPFPSVLSMMASDPGWTQALGNAVLTERPAVMDAVQRERQVAMNYGYLQSNQYDRVIAEPGAIQIVPMNAGLIYVPAYDPYVVFRRRARGFVGGVVRFGPGISIAAGFAPFGWSSPGLRWREHSIVVDGRPWDRNWSNRRAYEHPYEQRWARPAGPRVERHEYRSRDDHGRDDRGRGHDRDHR